MNVLKLTKEISGQDNKMLVERVINLKEILHRLETSIKHIKILDNFFQNNDNEYQRMEQELSNLGTDYIDFCRELYFGGDKNRGNPPRGSRQMILSDIFQYVLTSRLVYRAGVDENCKKNYVKILMYLINEWLILDCYGAREEKGKRDSLINALRSKIPDLNEENAEYHIEKLQELLDCETDVIPKEPNPNPPSSRILSAYDSLFPKIRGGPIEILVFIYLIQRNLGFVVSLLTQQILLNGNDETIPPDLLLLRRKGEVMGLEIGRGKERQSADFGLLTGLPTFSVDLWGKQPFRCDSCGRWIIYCKKIVESYSDNGVPNNHEPTFYCVNCPYFENGQCPDIICRIKRENRFGNEREARYHFKCLTADERDEIISNLPENSENLVAYYPLVEGLENFPEE